MKNKEKEDVIKAWDEVEEAHCSLDSLSNEDIIECIHSIKQRLENAMNILGEYFTDDEAKNQIGY